MDDLEAGKLHVDLRVDQAPPALLAALEALGTQPRALHDGAAPAPPGAPPGGAAYELTLSDEDLLPAIAERTLASGARLYALTPRRASLEQVFLQVVGKEDSGQ
jgi:ABC-2 type transport system ATP-binding protein